MAKRYPLALWRIRKELTMSQHAQLSAQDIAGPITQLLTNLQGDQGHQWLGALKALNRKEDYWSHLKEVKTWQTVVAGEYRHFGDVLVAIADARCLLQVSQHYFSRMTFSRKGTETDLVEISVDELGLADGTRTEAVYRRAYEFGLRLCTREIALLLLLKSIRISLKEVLYFAMEGRVTTDTMRILSLGKMGGVPVLSQDSYHGHQGRGWKKSDRFIFVKPRP